MMLYIEQLKRHKTAFKQCTLKLFFEHWLD